jgi:hypothetical protein
VAAFVLAMIFTVGPVVSRGSAIHSFFDDTPMPESKPYTYPQPLQQ